LPDVEVLLICPLMNLIVTFLESLNVTLDPHSCPEVHVIQFLLSLFVVSIKAGIILNTVFNFLLVLKGLFKWWTCEGHDMVFLVVWFQAISFIFVLVQVREVFSHYIVTSYWSSIRHFVKLRLMSTLRCCSIMINITLVEPSLVLQLVINVGPCQVSSFVLSSLSAETSSMVWPLHFVFIFVSLTQFVDSWLAQFCINIDRSTIEQSACCVLLIV
jgi:hypothetical protein